MNLSDCHNIADLRQMAKKRLPRAIFDYIDGGADDEITLRKNTSAFDTCDLIPSVLRDTAQVDLSVTLFGEKIEMPLYCSPTALQRLFHAQGEMAVATAAQKFSTLFGISSLATMAPEELGEHITGPKIFQFYYHKDRSLNDAMLARARKNGFNILALTVDTATGGNRERDLRSGFTSPVRLTTTSMLGFALHPRWTLDHLFGSAFDLPLLSDHIGQGSKIAVTVGDYFSSMLEPTLNWDHVRELRKKWDGPFCLKGVMSTADARRAAELGLDGVIVSNHGGRQLDGSATPFGQLAQIVDAIGDRMDVVCDGGIRRGSHVVKALAMGAKACSGGRFYLYGLAGAGQAGVEKSLSLMHDEIRRAMVLMGKQSVSELSRNDLHFTLPQSDNSHIQISSGNAQKPESKPVPVSDSAKNLPADSSSPDPTQISPKPTRRGRVSKHAGKRLKKLVADNPRRPDTAGWTSWNLIEDGMTYEQYINSGGRNEDLNHVVRQGYLQIY